MSPTFNLITTNYYGGTEGTAFDDRVQHGDLPSPVITKIGLRYAGSVSGLRVVMSNGKIYTHGADSGTHTLIEFETGEFVKRIEGYSDSACVRALTLVTNKGTYGPYGSISGARFEWGAAKGATPRAPRMWLLSFAGCCDFYLRGLQALFAQDRPDALPPMRYENLSTREIPVDTNTSSLPLEVSMSFSGFTFHLMSPTITLCVGADKVKLHAYEDTLCQLPFFNAALRGNFKEATEQVITMPEDNPSAVSALIEFMYTGNYTCTYDPASARLHEDSTTPVGSLGEGLFHIEIHTIATKYDYPGLATIATRNILVVVAELNSIDALRAWQAAYSAGLRLPGKRRDFEAYCDGRGLAAWLNCLVAEHLEEMEERIMECPALGFDLLRISIGEE